MEIILVLGYVLGFLVSGGLVYRVRAGLPANGRLTIFGPGGVGIGWFTLGFLKSIFWPIILPVWLLRGRPEPVIVFNEKARERAAMSLR